MLVLFRHLFGWLTRVFRSQADLILENQALRRQLLALHAHRPRPRLGSLDRMFWVTLRRLWMLDEGVCKSMIVREQA